MLSKFRIRQPLLVRAAIALLGVGAVRLGIAVDAIPAQWDINEARVEQLIDGAIAAWAWISARRVVTPVADPRDDRGRQLVESTGPYPMH
jgi:hypothetical protein